MNGAQWLASAARGADRRGRDRGDVPRVGDKRTDPDTEARKRFSSAILLP
jgi:hypothetical protein